MRIFKGKGKHSTLELESLLLEQSAMYSELKAFNTKLLQLIEKEVDIPCIDCEDNSICKDAFENMRCPYAKRFT